MELVRKRIIVVFLESMIKQYHRMMPFLYPSIYAESEMKNPRIKEQKIQSNSGVINAVG